MKRWYAEVRARPKVQAGLAIGKFVKEPFDEEARKDMFGQRRRSVGEEMTLTSARAACGRGRIASQIDPGRRAR